MKQYSDFKVQGVMVKVSLTLSLSRLFELVKEAEARPNELVRLAS